MNIREAKASTALSPSKLPGLDWALNPYRGCQHGCVYCYSADVMHMSAEDEWGTFVEVRRNIPVILAREKKKCSGTVGLGTVTDPYQPIEGKTMLTRYCLEQLAAGECRVCIQTKSDLVTRDIDILRTMKGAEVGITVSTMNPEIAAMLEPGAPEPAKRMAALAMLSGAGISTWVFLGPIIPGMNDSSESMEAVIKAAKQAGCSKVIYDKLRLKPILRERMKKRFGYSRTKDMFRLAGERDWEERVFIDIEVLCDDAGIKSEKAF
ncbi:MAG: radical SAM protein [Thermoplasmata archaeon]|nr:radical SAM protein [Thermoplasmata archaeon]